jgi:hypothetical protein
VEVLKKTLIKRAVCTLVLLLMAQGVSAADEQATSVNEQALTLLKRSADFIAGSRAISIAVEYGFDVVQASGQKVEFGGTRRIMVRRPDRARIEFARRDGTQGELVFDGKQVILVNKNEKLYSIENRSGDVGTVLDFVADKLGVPIPLRDFLAPDPAAVLTQGLVAARYGGEATIAGLPCDHLAFRTDAVDYQVWISRGEQPLPRRLVITYREAEGQPQFWAQFVTWDINPELGDSLFVYEPVDGAEEIPFIAPKSVSTAMGGGQ